MTDMKSDMSGAAAVASAMFAIAKAKLPVHIIGLVPATDNRLKVQAQKGAGGRSGAKREEAAGDGNAFFAQGSTRR